MTLTLDNKITPEQIEQFASQLVNVPENVRDQLVESFSGLHSKEFYEGLLAAYANMHVMLRGLQIDQLASYSGPITAFVADYVNKLNKLEQNKQ